MKMKTYLTTEQADNLVKLGLKADTADVCVEGKNTWSLPALLDIFPCGKNDPIFELTRGLYNNEGHYSRLWRASIQDMESSMYLCGDAKEPIDAVYKLLCEILKEGKV